MLNKNIIKNFFFDLDHTLWDFEKNSSLAFEKVFYELKIEVCLESFLKEYKKINKFLWKLYQEDSISHDDLKKFRLTKTFTKIDYEFDKGRISEISNLYIEYLSKYNHLLDGAIPLLNFLKDKYNINIITNGFEKVQSNKIISSGLSPFIMNLFTAESIGYKKPNPKIFLHALRKTDTLPLHAVMVGDDLEADIFGAMDVGMQAIHFNSKNKFTNNSFLSVNSLDDIINYLNFQGSN